jgi:hypothetical protein
MAGVVGELEGKQREKAAGLAQYDALIEAMRRVKAAMDTPGASPGAIIAAAGCVCARGRRLGG